MKLVTSNEDKIKEYNRFGLGIKALKGIDIDEVDADILTVCLYKSLMSPIGTLVEDTSLDVEGENVGVNVRWLCNELPKFTGKKCFWNVVLGYHTEDIVFLYSATLEGIIDGSRYVEESCGFDSIFVLENGKTLHDLEIIGEKDLFSPRKKVVEKFIEHDYTAKYKVKNIPLWRGKWQ